MPLPAALAAKLAKRGLLQKKHRAASSGAVSSNPTPGYVEEIIAESYDDDDTTSPASSAVKITPIRVTKFQYMGHIGCPNKYNVKHICSPFCVNRWGRGHSTAEHNYNRRRLRMLTKYPLPSGWQEVYDPGCARYYYWNLDTDDVCWLCPTHPRAKITRAAAEYRKQYLETGKDPLSSDIILVDSGKDADRRKNRERGKRRRDDLDPMDPASYSDIPRGDWSAGLEKPGDGKTGVDSTASGVLFQSRPYPNPGAILRANSSAETKGKKTKRN